VDWTRPTAVVLGNEKYGVSQEAVDLADACAVLPMAGYVESLNISVAAALIFYEAQQQRTRRLGHPGDLSEHEKLVLKAVHVVRSLVGAPAPVPAPPPAPPPRPRLPA
jgi:tRNA (guanosine-2'-O-)-methyltransferase